MTCGEWYFTIKAVKGLNTLAGFALGVVSTLALGALSQTRANGNPRLNRAGFQEALDAVIDRYVDPVDESELLAEGLKQLLSGLDPHSHFLTSKERESLRRKTRGGHAGLAVSMKLDGVLPGAPGRQARRLEVIAIEPGSPADEAGIRPGDHIIELRSHAVSELRSQVEAEALLAGSIGEPLPLRVQRRDQAGPESIELRLVGGSKKPVAGRLVDLGDGRKVAHLVVRAFSKGTGTMVKKSLASLRHAAGHRKLAGIVLDVRGNPGGMVDEALVMADLFITDGILMRTRGRGGRILREERAHARGTDEHSPLVVLQDRHSASASELLAIALSEHGRAKLVGERSYGKATVQEVHGLADGSVLTLTIARYHSPNDHLIEGHGVRPDVWVRNPGRPGERPDAGLDAALRTLDDNGR